MGSCTTIILLHIKDQFFFRNVSLSDDWFVRVLKYFFTFSNMRGKRCVCVWGGGGGGMGGEGVG